ncbi:MAG: histidine kinase [Bacteroidaceae bacterium]|nr:histidine kinase [Bacteroidaceae bacterium]
MKKYLLYFIALLWLTMPLTATRAASPIHPDETGGAPMESGLSYRRFTTIDGLPQMQTETVWQDARGYIYIGTLSGFVRYDGLSLTPFLRGRRENIVSFQEVRGQVRAMGFVRQWCIDGKKAAMVPIDPQGELLLNNFNAADLPPGYVLLEDRQEQNRVLCQAEADGMKHVLASKLLDEMTPDRKMYLDSTGIYIPTEQGLYVLEKDGEAPEAGSKSRRLTEKADLYSLIRQDDRLYALAYDGIYEVEKDSLRLCCAHRFEAPDYGLYARTYRGGQLIIADSHTIWLFDGYGTMSQLATGFNLIKGIFVDKWDRLWAATYQGAYCFFHCNFVNHRLTDRNDIVRAVSVNGGRLMMGTLNGNVFADGKLLSSIDGNFYAPSAATIDGTTYMAGNGDVAAVGGDSLRWLGLPHDQYRFVARNGKRLIIGTRGSVLSYDPSTRKLTTLTDEIVRPWCGADDGQGRLWVSGNPGLYCLTGTDGEGTSGVVVRKLKSTPGTQVITAMSTDGNGHVCFAVGDSLFAIRNGEIRMMNETLSALASHEIRSLHVSPKGYLAAATMDGLLVARLDDNCQASDIHWFNSQSGFSMIEPLTSTMAESDDGTLWLAGLEEMTSFRPEALLSDNQQSTVVRAPRPWWQRWWAWLLAAALMSLVIWRAARWVELRQARRRMAHLEREKMQKELQLSAVRLKAIPHFHANVLASIEYFVMNNSADEATHYMKLYSNFTNQTLSDIDKPSRSVTEEVEYVRSYLELERLRYGDRLQYSIDVAPDVNQNTQLPTMLLHTYCQNAVKHGIAAKSGVGNVKVTVSRQQRDEADGILVAVSDDGIGRTEAAHSSGPSTKQGLKILGQQIELYNRTNRHKITQHVTDLTDKEGCPAGTCFETWIPLDYQY